MRDWSSDVCSSDLGDPHAQRRDAARLAPIDLPPAERPEQAPQQAAQSHGQPLRQPPDEPEQQGDRVSAGTGPLFLRHVQRWDSSKRMPPVAAGWTKAIRAPPLLGAHMRFSRMFDAESHICG